MRLGMLLGTIFLATGLGAPIAYSSHNDGQLTCRFGDHEGKGSGSQCTATFRACTETLDRCEGGLEIICGGLQILFAEEPTVQVIDQNGIGVTLLGDTGAGYPHVAVDASLLEPFQHVFANLYLTPYERLSGKCSSTIEGEVEVRQ